MDFALSYFAAAGMIAAGTGFLIFLYRKTGTLLPADAVERLGSLMSMALIVTAGLLVYVTYRVDSGSGFVVSGEPRLEATELGAPAPDFAFVELLSEEETRLSDYRGKVILLNWWATWCAPCLEELPALNGLQDRYADEGLVVLTISDESRATLVDFNNELPLRTVAGYVQGEHLKNLSDPFRRTLQIRPTTYAIDRDGVIRDFVLGAQDAPAFERMIAPWLKQTVPSE